MFKAVLFSLVALWLPLSLQAAPLNSRADLIAVSCGSSTANGSFAADNYFSGGSTYTSGTPVDTSGVLNPAPQATYRSQRYGNFTYTFPGLVAGAKYLLRLHFAEIYWNAPGARVFNVSIVGGAQVLTNFDIFAASGGKNIANIQEIQAIADQNGTIAIQFTTVVDNASVSGIEVSLMTPPPAPSYNLKISSDKAFYAVGDNATLLLSLSGAPTNSDYDFYVGATWNGAPIGLTAITSQQSYAITPPLANGTGVFTATVYLENTSQTAAFNQAISFYNSDISSLTAQLNATSDPNTRATLQAKIAHDQDRLAATQAALANSRVQVGVPSIFNVSAQ